MNEEKDETLSQLFDKALHLHSEVSESTVNSSDQEYQDKVKKGILMLEDATRLVSILDIFSRNESYLELQTESLKYFLLPVLLGIRLNPIYCSSHCIFRGSDFQVSR